MNYNLPLLLSITFSIGSGLSSDRLYMHSALHLGNSDTVKGDIMFHQTRPGSPVKIFGKVTGLTPGKHALRVHEFGDISTCDAIGPAFRLKTNIVADDHGVADFQMYDYSITLDPVASHNVFARAVAIYEHGDDSVGVGSLDANFENHWMTDDSEPAVDNAGAKLACGVFGRCQF